VRRLSCAAAVTAILVLTVGCAPEGVSAPSPTIGAPRPTPSLTGAPIPVPSVVPSATPPRATLPPLTDLGGLFRSVATGWRATGETAIVQQPAGIDGTVLIAVPLEGRAPGGTPLVAFGSNVGWDVRRDGSAIAVGLIAEVGSSRIAIWDARTGAVRWVTPLDPGVLQTNPIWSADGNAIFYSALRAPDDLGIFRVSADGSRPTRIKPPEGNGAQLHGLTPDGRGLVWARIQAGGTTEVLDLATGRNTSFDAATASYPARWRSTRPRALVITGACCAGGGRGTLVLWDDQGGTSRALFGSQLTPQEAVVSADWDPTGTRIVAVVYDNTISRDVSGPLMTMSAEGGERSTVSGTSGARDVRWLRAGLVYSKGIATGEGLYIVPANGGPPATIFEGDYLGIWKVIAP